MHTDAKTSSANDLFWYKRDAQKRDYIPRIAAVHDLCGYGKCSLGVAIPVLSAAGCDVCPVPTSLFSAHTLFDEFYYLDTTHMLTPYLDAWEKEGVEIDAVYSGFLGSAEQIDAIKRIYRMFPQALRFVDPVMGDAGKMYPTYTDELCRATAALVKGAHVLTPNLTEASLLTGIPYEGNVLNRSQINERIDALLEMGAESVILKGIEDPTRPFLYNYLGGRNIETVCMEHAKLDFNLHGTGDLFASSTLGAIMCGRSLTAAVEFAADFVYNSMELSTKQPNYAMRGVSFERCLGEVCKLTKE